MGPGFESLRAYSHKDRFRKGLLLFRNFFCPYFQTVRRRCGGLGYGPFFLTGFIRSVTFQGTALFPHSGFGHVAESRVLPFVSGNFKCKLCFIFLSGFC